MAGIRARDTKPERQIRSALHRLGFRFRLHSKKLPGRPDLVLAKYRAAVFVHGCFWHGHDCALFRWPETRRAFWKAKITANQARDARVKAEVLAEGWRYLGIWECAVRSGKVSVAWTAGRAVRWLASGRRSGDIRSAVKH